jgi:DNA-binding protein YbaB
MATEYVNISNELLRAVDEFSDYQLKEKKGLLMIFEESVTNNKERQLEELSFTAKYIKGLLRVIKSGTGNSDVTNLEAIKKDYSVSMAKVVEQIKEIISSASTETKNHFEQTYFELNQQSFHNLNDLLTDLEWTKKYLNDNKRKN